MKKYLNISTFYLVIGLVLGIFYRELTKINEFSGQTVLSTAHTHALVLGFIFFLIVMILEKSFEISSVKGMNLWVIFYNISFISMLATIIARGVMQVLGVDFIGLSHIAGLTHAMLGVSLIWFVVIIRKVIK